MRHALGLSLLKVVVALPVLDWISFSREHSLDAKEPR